MVNSLFLLTAVPTSSSLVNQTTAGKMKIKTFIRGLFKSPNDLARLLLRCVMSRLIKVLKRGKWNVRSRTILQLLMIVQATAVSNCRGLNENLKWRNLWSSESHRSDLTSNSTYALRHPSLSHIICINACSLSLSSDLGTMPTEPAKPGKFGELLFKFFKGSFTNCIPIGVRRKYWVFMFMGSQTNFSGALWNRPHCFKIVILFINCRFKKRIIIFSWEIGEKMLHKIPHLA